MHPDAETRLDRLRQALDRRVAGEVLAAVLVGAAGPRVRRLVASGTGTAPRLAPRLVLATTPTRLVLLEAHDGDAVTVGRLVGDWPLDLTRVDATAVRVHTHDRWGVTLAVPGEELELVLDALRGPAVDDLLGSIVATTGGRLLA